MNDPKPLRSFAPEPPPPAADPGTAYAGRTRYTQLEYEALLANLSLGIAFTRERRFFLCNPKFAEMFGYGPDERRYAVAGAMLALLGFREIVLMTNNPDKIEALENFGVNVVGHRRLIGGVNPHNHNYLKTKADRAGHLLDGFGRLNARKK